VQREGARRGRQRQQANCHAEQHQTDHERRRETDTTELLPAGFSFSAAGVLSGTAVASGTFNFSITSTDSFGSAGTRAYALIVQP
jgi:Putative Ig domain